jgi:hypothetical protein
MLLQDPKEYKKDRTRMEAKWKMVLKMAQEKNPLVKDVEVPYTDTHIVG